MNHTRNAVMTPMPMMAAAAIPAMDPILIPPESLLVVVALGALLVLLAATWTVERVTELTGAVVLVKVLAGGVVGTTLDEVVREVVVEVETDEEEEDDDTEDEDVLDVETTLEVVVVVRKSGGPVGSIGICAGVDVVAAVVLVVVVSVKTPIGRGVSTRLWTFLNVIFLEI
jgi:hypothetical protein